MLGLGLVEAGESGKEKPSVVCPLGITLLPKENSNLIWLCVFEKIYLLQKRLIKYRAMQEGKKASIIKTEEKKTCEAQQVGGVDKITAHKRNVLRSRKRTWF